MLDIPSVHFIRHFGFKGHTFCVLKLKPIHACCQTLWQSKYCQTEAASRVHPYKPDTGERAGVRGVPHGEGRKKKKALRDRWQEMQKPGLSFHGNSKFFNG